MSELFSHIRLLKIQFKILILLTIFYGTLLRYNLYIVRSTNINSDTNNKNPTAMEHTLQCVNCMNIFLHFYISTPWPPLTSRQRHADHPQKAP